MRNEVFDFQNYKIYLNDWLKSHHNQGYGLRAEIAQAVRCQQAYISQILNGDAHFNLEQADALSSYLGHSEEERHFFLLLIQKERAGTQKLRDYFQSQLNLISQRRLNLKERIDVKKTLSLENQAVYYSTWHYAAIHVALSIPELQTKAAIAQYFGLSSKRTSMVLDFLVSVGLAVRSAGKFQIGTARIHLAEDSPLILSHHSNWRMKALEAMNQSDEADLHYSSVVTLSKSDVIKLKSKIIRWITEAKALIRESKEEEIRCLSFDCF